MAGKNKEMTRKTKYFMYTGSFIYALAMVTRVPYFWRFMLLLILTVCLSFIIDEPIEGRVRKMFTVLLFLFFVGTLTGLMLMLAKILIINMYSARVQGIPAGTHDLGSFLNLL